LSLVSCHKSLPDRLLIIDNASNTAAYVQFMNDLGLRSKVNAHDAGIAERDRRQFFHASVMNSLSVRARVILFAK
jgi:hypothetical protein